ncbi:choline ABC transporter substrate-binding protein [Citreicella sp. C3M06]|uniref:choline ABC transporter substrate-binding protein n=1 Tax=Citreicella sp. C3M06 TaxID=2841564 RepID=UPI001C09DA2B|nr:choline ABC transporter substrate-binding protein [Citreicella sp. C3M06]MBU2961702.1 choline ABC transporter substrate-binding protein [Citreicella sp. C3M06]
MKLVSTVSALALSSTAAFADCDTVTMSDVGWTDITTTTAAAKHVIEALGYDVNVKVLSVPVTFASLESDDVDVFLGNWMPAQNSSIAPYLDSGEIESINTNLEGTKYTLATTQAAWDAGLQSYADIAKFEDELDGKIYGIEPGNEGNAYLVSLIEENTFGLGEFEVVESSEQGMLAQARRLVDDGDFVVFLGWEPHPMNANFDLKYLPGGEDFFGGEGVVNTVTRKGYAAECPNLGKLFGQMDFSLPMENLIMGQILDDGADPEDATLDWIKANPEAVLAWVDGVSTLGGEDGTAAVKAEFGF